MSDVQLEIVSVKAAEDWHKVGQYLFKKIESMPVVAPAPYSATSEEAFAKAQDLVDAGRAQEVLSCSVAALYQGKLISMVLTREPGQMHLSLVEVVPNVGVVPISDAMIAEIVPRILPTNEERQEGVIKEVRHFFQAIS